MNKKTSIAILIVIVILGAIGYFTFVKKSNLVQSPVPIVAAPSPGSTPTASNQTIGMKTVTNDVLHFSVNIPIDYNLVMDVSSPDEPIYSRYAINNAADNGMQG